MRIAVIADSHYSSTLKVTCRVRQTGIADTIIRQAVTTLNDVWHPDVTLLLGDMVNSGACSHGHADLQRLAEESAKLKSPCLAIPGNHDGTPDLFYRAFPRPAEISDVAGVRFILNQNDDLKRPGWNAWRSEAGLELLRRARRGYTGPIVSVQHVPVFPEGAVSCPYNYENWRDIVELEEACGVSLSLAGHFHSGYGPLVSGRVTRVAASAICEPPFAMLIIDFAEDRTAIQRIFLDIKGGVTC